MSAITLRHYTHADRAAIRQTLIDIHAALPESDPGDPFTARFPWFVDHWTGSPGFTCVIAYDGEAPAGFVYGAPLADGREWWRGHTEPPTGQTATYGVSELAVGARWRGTGLSARLHDALLVGRTESLAVLSVDSEHPKVQALYERWGYRKVGERRPFADSPLFAVMLRTLP
ncbi:GNAT family N-acetyltransferase [Streptomyces uncialis]|uniref:GNAT family N-acetyltransferase n=1 Tax=Streptomyces uncialis TaxID=1048205 RepID=UPI00386C7014